MKACRKNAPNAIAKRAMSVEKVFCAMLLCVGGERRYRAVVLGLGGLGYGDRGRVCTTQVFAMDVDASLMYCAGVSFQAVSGCVNVENAREVIEVGWTVGRNEWARNLTFPLGEEMKRSSVMIVMEVSAPATAIACWSIPDGEEASRWATDRAVADLIFLCRRFLRVMTPEISSSRSSEPVPLGLF